jgi:hypothetical protein
MEDDEKLLRLSLLMIDELLLRLRACCPPNPSCNSVLRLTPASSAATDDFLVATGRAFERCAPAPGASGHRGIAQRHGPATVEAIASGVGSPICRVTVEGWRSCQHGGGEMTLRTGQELYARLQDASENRRSGLNVGEA